MCSLCTPLPSFQEVVRTAILGHLKKQEKEKMKISRELLKNLTDKIRLDFYAFHESTIRSVNCQITDSVTLKRQNDNFEWFAEKLNNYHLSVTSLLNVKPEIKKQMYLVAMFRLPNGSIKASNPMRVASKSQKLESFYGNTVIENFYFEVEE